MRLPALPKPLVATMTVAVVAACAGLAGPAEADRSDRTKPMVIEADRSGTVDLQRQVLAYSGNVTISQGTMLLRAEQVELRELPNGFRAATATGSAGRPVTWRQKRDGSDEFVEGSAERIEFDGRADTLRLIGNASVRRLRNGVAADEITGASILWDNLGEVFKVEGGNATPVNPQGRVRAVLSPRVEPAAAPPSGAASGAPLQPSRSLGGPGDGKR